MPSPDIASKQLLILRRGLNSYRNSLVMNESLNGASVHDTITTILASADARTVAARKPGRPCKPRATTSGISK